MTTFRLGSVTLAKSWEPLLHSSIRSLAFPPVPNIDCDHCWMEKMGLFGKNIKCCTYTPNFPNFLAGEILTDGYAEGGQSSIVEWIAERRGGPLMTHVPPGERDRFQRTYDDPQDQPGCPLLDDNGRCTVYEHRPPLCIGYHCHYPQNPALIGFWNSLCSLLELHTILAAQYILGKQGWDKVAFNAFWQTHPFDEIWEENSIRQEESLALWQGNTEHEAFYKGCYQYLLEHADSIRDDLAVYRREQLLAGLKEQPNPDSKRIEQLEDEPLVPEPLSPPPEAYQAFMSGHRILFPANHWSLYENESYILWFHEQAYGRQTA